MSLKSIFLKSLPHLWLSWLGHHWFRWWKGTKPLSSTVRCWDICRHSDGLICAPYKYETLVTALECLIFMWILDLKMVQHNRSINQTILVFQHPCVSIRLMVGKWISTGRKRDYLLVAMTSGLICPNPSKVNPLSNAAYLLISLRTHHWGLLLNSLTLTQCGLVVPYGGIDLGQHWLQ